MTICPIFLLVKNKCSIFVNSFEQKNGAGLSKKYGASSNVRFVVFGECSAAFVNFTSTGTLKQPPRRASVPTQRFWHMPIPLFNSFIHKINSPSAFARLATTNIRQKQGLLSARPFARSTVQHIARSNRLCICSTSQRCRKKANCKKVATKKKNYRITSQTDV